MLRSRPLAVCLSVALWVPAALAQPSASARAPAKPAPAPAAQILWIGDLDTNHDGRISAQEVANRPIIAKSFAAMDLNHDGFLTNSEVQAAWQEHVAQTYAQQRPERLRRFDLADTDKDGRLSLDEAKAGMPRVAANFTELDTNKSGFLSRDQVAAAGQLFFRQDIAEWRQRNAQAFAALDTNHDGKLSKAELEAKMPRLAKSFAFMDEDHDGSLSPTEFTLPLN